MKSKYHIGDMCITCGRCERNCPKGAIFAGPRHYEINEENCIGCGLCYKLCPLATITKEDVE